MKDYPAQYYPILSDSYALPVWVGFLAKKNSLKTGITFGIEEVKVDLNAKAM